MPIPRLHIFTISRKYAICVNKDVGFIFLISFPAITDIYDTDQRHKNIHECTDDKSFRLTNQRTEHILSRREQTAAKHALWLSGADQDIHSINLWMSTFRASSCGPLLSESFVLTLPPSAWRFAETGVRYVVFPFFPQILTLRSWK